MNNHIEKLRKIYKDGDLIPFIGAGLSIPFDVPGWGKLIKDCALSMGIEDVKGKSFINVIDHNLDEYDYWEAVRCIKKYLHRSEEDIQEYIVSTINRNIVTEIDDKFNNYKDLAKYDFGIYITTNYDHIMQKYLDTNFMPMNLKDFNSNSQYLLKEKEIKRIFHLHGNISDSSSIVISEEKYNELYKDNKYRMLFSLFSGAKTFIFMGFSFNDIFIQKIIKDNNEFFKTKHYIILEDPTDEKIKLLKEQYNLETIAYYTNDSSHPEEIRKILNSICGDEFSINENQNLKNYVKNDLYSCYNLPSENDVFTGRTDILNIIKESLNKQHLFVISGIAGIGKTQIAKKYAYINKSKYKSIFWIDSDNISQLDEEYISLALYLKLKVDKNKKVTIENIKNYFENSQYNLIIFDNADNIEFNDLKNYFPRKGTDIIVTTKNANWDMEKVNNIKIEDFDETEAKTFLLNNTSKRTFKNNEEENCTSLVRELRCYPLALEHSRAYINKMEISFSAYLDIFNEYRFEAMKNKVLDYNETVLTTFKMSFDKLEEQNDKNFELLALCAFLYFDKIPSKELFLDSKLYNKLELDTIIDGLMGYSLINIHNGFISVHGVIQELVRNELKKRGTYKNLLHEALSITNEIFPKDIQKVDDKNLTNILIKHIISVYKYLEFEKFDEQIKANISTKIGFAFQNLGLHEDGLYYLYKAKEYYINAGNIDKGCAIMERIGLSYHRIGRSDESLDILLDAEHMIEDMMDNRILGNILRSIGIVYKDRRDIDLSLDYHKRALKLGEIENDKNLIFNQLLNIGIIYKTKKEYDEAGEYYNKAENMLKDIDDGKLEYKLHGNIGYLYKERGLFEEAIKYFSKALEMAIMLGDEISQAISLDHIGSCYIDDGFAKRQYIIINKSIDYLEKALEISQRITYKYGEATTLLNIGRYYFYSNDIKSAKDFFEEALNLSREIGYTQAENIAKNNLNLINNN